MSVHRVIVASANPVKLRAVADAFARLLDAASAEVVGVAVPSGVAAQPMSDAATLRGARNRARAARVSRPDAGFWVGIEGGVDRLDERLIGFAWMAVLAADGRCGEARTVTLPLPPPVQQLLDQGVELGETNDRVFATVDSKREGGAFGLLTDGLYTRRSVYTEALVMALLPLLHPLYGPADGTLA